MDITSLMAVFVYLPFCAATIDLSATPVDPTVTSEDSIASTTDPSTTTTEQTTTNIDLTTTYTDSTTIDTDLRDVITGSTLFTDEPTATPTIGEDDFLFIVYVAVPVGVIVIIIVVLCVALSIRQKLTCDQKRTNASNNNSSPSDDYESLQVQRNSSAENEYDAIENYEMLQGLCYKAVMTIINFKDNEH